MRASLCYPISRRHRQWYFIAPIISDSNWLRLLFVSRNDLFLEWLCKSFRLWFDRTMSTVYTCIRNGVTQLFGYGYRFDCDSVAVMTLETKRTQRASCVPARIYGNGNRQWRQRGGNGINSSWDSVFLLPALFPSHPLNTHAVATAAATTSTAAAAVKIIIIILPRFYSRTLY